MAELKLLLEELKPHQEKLANHPIYKSLTSIDDVKLFMENHVFAVWDFMSLLKALQLKLTSVCVPWLPPLAPSTSRFINEIVLGEESDLNDQGIPKSHFEMYLDAMKEVGACTHQIELFIMKIQSGNNINEAIQNIEIAEETKSFVKKTFNVIHSNKAHLIAASFTFGREDVIPEMFLALLNNIDPQNSKFAKLRFYLERHIELDGDEHGPLSLKMIQELCGNDEKKWEEVKEISIESLEARYQLWSGINEEVNTLVV